MLIAQISDIHLRASGILLCGRFDSIDALERTVTHLNRLDPAPDVVLATGDLTNEGLAEDYALLRRQLDRLAMPYYVIPGNHDEREPLRAAFVDLGYLPSQGFLHYTVERYSLRLIGLDTVIPGEVAGGLCSERLAWLAARLEEDPRRPTLIFMHHPPIASGIRFMDSPPFEGGEAMAALIHRHPHVRQIVCGHMHRSIHAGWGGTAVTVAPSSVFQMTLELREGGRFAPAADPPAVGLYLWEETAGLRGYVSLVEGDPA